jgi:hypothetical protein
MSTTRSFAHIACLAILGSLTLLDHFAIAQVVADSVAQFSGTQSLNGWSYGYYDGDTPGAYTPADFELLPLFDGIQWLIEDTSFQSGPPPHGYWTRLTATGGHPNGNLTTTALSANHWAVRRWTSSQSATYMISGLLKDDNAAPISSFEYNGVIGHIFVDGAEVLTLPINEGGIVNYSINVSLNTGSNVDFAIDAKKSALNPNRTIDWTDATTFTAQISLPEPASASIAGAAVLALSVGRLRSRVRRMQRIA